MLIVQLTCARILDLGDVCLGLFWLLDLAYKAPKTFGWTLLHDGINKKPISKPPS
jgi:hypothetical protein